MQNLYAVRLVAGAPSESAFTSMCELTLSWALNTTEPRSLPLSGERDLADRSVRWARQGLPDGSEELLSLVVAHHPDEYGARFEVRVSVGRTPTEVATFVSIGRDSADRVLAPARLSWLERPRLVPDIVNQVPCRNGKLLLSAVPRQVLAGDVDGLVDDLHDPARAIPIVTVVAGDTGDKDSPDLARLLADRLCGLAQIVLFDGWLAYDSFVSRVPSGRMPKRGARLFWPGFGGSRRNLHHPWWTPSYIEHEGRKPFASHLFAMLARLSVMAEPHDRIALAVQQDLRQHERTAQAARLAEAQERIAEAEARGDQTELVAELRGKLTVTERYAEELLEQNLRLEEHVRSLERERSSYLDALRASTARPRSDRDPDSVPDEPEDDRDFTRLWNELETQSNGAIVFTSAARRSWAKCGYRDARRMRVALDLLAIAAAEWRNLRAELGKSMVSWIHEQTGLTYAPSDEALRKKQLDRFFHDGVEYSREPHIKLDDRVPPNRVGRIYFGIDMANLRWIVDHVGLKLYHL